MKEGRERGGVMEQRAHGVVVKESKHRTYRLSGAAPIGAE
jgi:hypothetical protein